MKKRLGTLFGVLLLIGVIGAWVVSRPEVSQLVWYATAGLACNTTCQLLQSPGWSDEQLARLQAGWSGVDLFKDLPETMAFKRASAVAVCELERNRPADERFSLTEFSKEAFRHPSYAWPELKSIWKRSA